MKSIVGMKQSGEEIRCGEQTEGIQTTLEYQGTSEQGKMAAENSLMIPTQGLIPTA